MLDNLMIKTDNVSKEYRLGAIGGTTLHDELQRLRAKRKKQDVIQEIKIEENNEL